ncbi:hypothetical protein NEHOM01_0963 [Nematocida homosporus]|uniref:uncharacterized protein n=1 Tax=Nematocida homosporus TaxID=1912981 RepID=UPI0022206EFD|nr:uncharacterized protein NEHOM01_0963 [Nematocida homosporus]KAI5185637.1 hypothetical protein NEHOM01_0963 [Nematocida homosporus]
MESVFRLVNFGIKEEKTRSQVESIAESLGDSLGVLWLSSNEVLYARNCAIYRKQVPISTSTSSDKSTDKSNDNSSDKKITSKGDKLFAKMGQTISRLLMSDNVVVAGTREGALRLFDTSGKRLGHLSTPPGLRALCFIRTDMLCLGGESCLLHIFSLTGEVLLEKAFPEYIESVTASQTHLVVGLANGDVYLYAYKVVDSSQSKVELEEVLVFSLGRAAVVQFISAELFLVGLSSGYAYIYSVVQGVVAEAALHSKAITQAQTLGEFVVTSSLDGRLRISTSHLREITSLYLGVGLTTFAAIKSPVLGSAYLLLTSAGDLLAYRDRWEEVKTSEPMRVANKTPPRTLFQHTRAQTTPITNTTKLGFTAYVKLSRCEMLMKSFQYRRALSEAIQVEDRETVTAILEYLFTANRLTTTIRTLSDQDHSYLVDTMTDLLRNKKFYPVAHEVLLIYTRALAARTPQTITPLQHPLDRAIQEAKEEWEVQSMTQTTLNYAHMLLQDMQ